MSCYETEKISLLIDGELDVEEARRVERHLDSCAACRRVKEDFLILRERISSYPLAADAASANRALEKILAAGIVAPAVESAGERRAPWRNLFVLPRMNPALASAMAVVIFAVVVGVIWSLSGRDTKQKFVADKTEQGDVRENNNDGNGGQPSSASNENPSAPGAGEVTKTGATNSESEDATPAATEQRSTDRPRRVQRSTPLTNGGRTEVANHALRGESAKDPLAEFEPLFQAASNDVVGEMVAFKHEPPVVATNETARHFEQAQVLLRSFRNAQPEGSATVADERGRSQRLLYRNIVLRGEAARTGNAPVARALDSLEPILIDIANLPENPGKEDVSAIRERMEKKNIVAVLQANVAAVGRAY